MRALVLTSLYPPHAVGGYELACRDVVDRWRDAGHDVTVLTSAARAPGADEPADEPGVARRLTLFGGGPPGTEHPRGLLERELAILRDHRVVRQLLGQTAPDVVSAWHMGGLTMSLLGLIARAGVPVVSVTCDTWPAYWGDRDVSRAGLSGRLRRRVDLRAGVTWVACSESLSAQLAASSSGIQTDAVVGLGVDPRHFPQVTSSEAAWRSRVLLVGRIVEHKGVETAVRAFALLPDHATLRLVGHGRPDYIDHLVRLAHELGVEARLTISAAPREELREHYLDADVVVFPSEWDEPFGIVPLEAMACARPVVATGLGGSGEYLVDGGNCLLVPPADPAALASRILELADNSALRRRLVAGGTRTAGTHTTDRLAERLEQIHLGAAGIERSHAGSEDSSSSGAE